MSRIKTFLTNSGWVFLGFTVINIFACLGFAWVAGGAWLAERVLPWLSNAAAWLLIICILVFLPLAVARRTRAVGGLGFFVASYVFGISAWLLGAFVTWNIAGVFFLVCGIALFGVGVIPIGIICLCFKGMWADAATLTGISVFAIGVRILGLRLVNSDQQNNEASVAQLEDYPEQTNAKLVELTNALAWSRHRLEESIHNLNPNDGSGPFLPLFSNWWPRRENQELEIDEAVKRYEEEHDLVPPEFTSFGQWRRENMKLSLDEAMELYISKYIVLSPISIKKPDAGTMTMAKVILFQNSDLTRDPGFPVFRDVIRAARKLNEINITRYEGELSGKFRSHKLELLNNPETFFSFGNMAFDGDGVPQDFEEAANWYRLAAQRGHSGAQHNLAFMYENGQGVRQDYAEAARWYKLAAKQANAGAQNNLGSLLELGKGVEKNVEEAIALYRKATAGGDTNAPANLKRLGIPLEG